MKLIIRTFLFVLIAITMATGYHLYINYENIKRQARDYMHNPPSMVGDYLSARFSAQENDIETALAYYLSALQKEPHNTDLIRRIYQMRFALGQFEAAEPLILRHYKLDNSSEFAIIYKTIVDIKHQRYDEALSTITNGLSNTKHIKQGDLKLLVMPMLKLWSLVGLNRYDEAFAYLDENTTPHMSNFHDLQRARMYIMQKKYNEAEAILSQHISNDSPYLSLINIASFFHLDTNEKAKNDVLSIINQGKLTPAVSSAMIEKNAALLTTLDKAVADIFLEEAAFVAALKQHDSAIIYLQTSRYLQPDNDYALMIMAGLYEKKKDYARANTIYNNLPATSDFFNKSAINIALNYNRLKQPDKAEKHLRKLLESTSLKTEAHITLGDILLRNKSYDKAVTIYTELLNDWDNIKDTTSSPLWALHYATGICYERLKQWEKSESHFLTALELSPRQPSVLNYLGYSWLTMDKNIEEAERMLKIALSHRPTDPHIMDSYGWALYKSGDYEGALSFIEKANLLLPHDITTNDHLGDVYWALGRKLEAHYQWERAITLEPEHEDVAKIKAKLTSGQGTEFSMNHSTDIIPSNITNTTQE